MSGNTQSLRWSQAALLDERDLGVLLALVTLLLGVVSRSYQAKPTNQ